MARENRDRKVVFLGVGFETTAPTAAAALLAARQADLANFWIYPAQKTVPPALSALMERARSLRGRFSRRASPARTGKSGGVSLRSSAWSSP